MKKEELKKKRESFGLPAYFRAKQEIKVLPSNSEAGSYFRALARIKPSTRPAFSGTVLD